MSVQFIRAQLAEIRDGRRDLGAEEYAALLSALAVAVDVLADAPRDDDVAVGIWHRHERTRALNEIAVALGADPPASDASPMTDEEAARALIDAFRRDSGR
jgi:hypothetical protein